MPEWVLLSRAGSDRATAYEMSSKIVRRGQDLFVGWLDAPSRPGGPTRIQLGVCDGATGVLRRAFALGEGVDNHCGPALALDGTGRLHLVTGAHHGPFLYRWSDRPADPASWSEPEPLGPADTYPALAVDHAGTLHLAYRERGERWQLCYRRKRPGQPWEAPLALAVSPTPGYNHFMQALAVGPTGTLHLTFQYHYAASGRAEDCLGRMAGYLRSEDGGETWYNESRRCGDLPLAVDTLEPICAFPAGGVHVGNLVVDGEDRPWLCGSIPGMPGGVLWRREGEAWQAIDLSPALAPLDMEGGRAMSLSRGPQGQIHLVVAADPTGKRTPWFDPGLELSHLVLSPEGEVLSRSDLTGRNAAVARWLPALEMWDWTRAETCGAGGLWLAYTAGLNAGGIHGDNRNVTQTEVYLGRLP